MHSVRLGSPGRFDRPWASFLPCLIDSLVPAHIVKLVAHFQCHFGHWGLVGIYKFLFLCLYNSQFPTTRESLCLLFSFATLICSPVNEWHCCSIGVTHNEDQNTGWMRFCYLFHCRSSKSLKEKKTLQIQAEKHVLIIIQSFNRIFCTFGESHHNISTCIYNQSVHKNHLESQHDHLTRLT